MDNLFYGDQTSPVAFSEVIQRAKDIGMYDIVIDDGGHTTLCIITTVHELLLTVVKPGGMLIIEDMHTFSNPKYTSYSGGNHLHFFQELVEDQLRMAVRAGRGVLKHPELSLEISSVDCMRELCIVTRKATPQLDDLWFPVYKDCIGTPKCDCGVVEGGGNCI